MTRAEFFVMRGRGHWAKCRKEFRCEFAVGALRCVYRVAPGEVYLATDIPLYPTAQPRSRESNIMRRYCAHCAGQPILPSDGQVH